MKATKHHLKRNGLILAWALVFSMIIQLMPVLQAEVHADDGSSWQLVGGESVSAAAASNVSMAVYDDTPYVVYKDSQYNNKATVIKYEGSDWVTVGSAGFSGRNPRDLSIAISNSGTPYILYRNEEDRATVMKYDESNWVYVGAAGFTEAEAYGSSIAIDSSGTPYVGFSDVAGHWALAAILKVQGAGIIRGYEDGTYKPEKLLTRAEAVAIINKVLGRGPVQGFTQSSWKDVPSTHWALQDIEEASVDHAFEKSPVQGEQWIQQS